MLTTSPPGSVHFVGAAVQRLTGARWVADLRDSLLAHPHRRADSAALKAKERMRHAVARLVQASADAIVAASEAIAEETRSLRPRADVVTIENGCDFDDFAGLEHHASPRFRITHAGSFFGERDPRPFLTALADSGLDAVARFVGDFRAVDREWAGDARARRPSRAARVRAAPSGARAAARLRGAAPAHPRGRRPREGACSRGRCSSTSPRSARSSRPCRRTARPPR